MKLCVLEVKFSPPMPEPGPWIRNDTGGFVYRVRNDTGVLVCGTSGSLDPNVALERAKRVAREKGFTHWRYIDHPQGWVQLL